MTDLSRRSWLKGAGLMSSLAVIGGIAPIHQLSAKEIKKFRPRPLTGNIKLSSNENPYGPSEKVRQAMISNFDQACRYPFSYSGELIEKIAAKEGVSKDHIVLAGGSTEGLKVVGLTYGMNGGEIIAAQPTFLALMTYAAQWGGSVNWVPVDKNMMHDLDEMEKRISSKTKLIFLCNPNNPTSTLLPADRVLDFCNTVSDKVTIFSDEAYYDFIEDKNYPSMVSLVKKGKNIIVSKTFSKVYGLAGLRIGYMVAKPEIAAGLRKNIMAFTNVLAIEAAKNALDDQEFYDFSLNKTVEAKKIILEGLDDLNLEYAPSNTNFIFFKSGRNIEKLQQQMLAKGIMVGRPFPPFDDWCRISTGTLEEVIQFNDALKKVLS
ncbi:aminotransferase class I/II-fold pyridoxal phosphate-dependent enzyme [Cyclobacteriaceae bacterium]|jgi:histidinol-phosphate aminotransferase|nr:aminotransferase class I/II-fold pyridoxal phosphate-dependent enzyme [Cyclobacteriaceae bacterium]MDC1516418.1 aminotransferase class I/II-fold pyridoxal phosphate-dependent enzyme [Cyclobacteriaceae bacterium]